MGLDSESSEAALCVVGVGLPGTCREELKKAFADCIFLMPNADVHSKARGLCTAHGRVVLFNYVPAMSAAMWLRTSAAFASNQVKIVGVDPACTEELYDRALEAEFAGVLCSDSNATAYLRAAMTVSAGELWFPRGYLSRRARASVSVFSAGKLSQREADVLALLATGTTNQDIADRLFISRDTVRWHLRSIYGKLGVSDRDAACRLARNARTPATSDLVIEGSLVG